MEMTHCPDSDCKEDVKRMKRNLYGEGPEGEKGVYGALKMKVSYKVFSVLFAVAMAIIGWSMAHESRISKTESMVNVLCEDVKGLKTQGEKSTKAILDAIKDIKRE